MPDGGQGLREAPDRASTEPPIARVVVRRAGGPEGHVGARANPWSASFAMPVDEEEVKLETPSESEADVAGASRGSSPHYQKSVDLR